MQKKFIDCGFHHGEGLQHFIESLHIDKTWCIGAFEPNPACDAINRFDNILKTIPGINIGVCFIEQSAVWVNDGTIRFNQENHFKTNSGSPVDGKSMIDGWASHITNLNYLKEGFEDPIEVEAINFSHFIDQVMWANNQSEIYCKMDIEGAEFAVLRKMLKDDTVRHIKKLWVEFHENDVPGESFKRKRELIEQLSQHTTVIEWH